MNPHKNKSTVVYDEHEFSAVVKGGEIIINWDDYPYHVPVSHGMIGFLDMDLSEFSKNAKEFSEEFILPEHPYIKVFPPEFSETSEKAYRKCIEFYTQLQNKFTGLVTFCFNQGFYFEELGELTAHQRLHVYASIHNGAIPQEVKQIYLLDGEVVESFAEKKEPSPLERTFSIPAGYIEHVKNSNAKMIKQYNLTCTFDALCLEFYEMLGMNIKIKKCKNCGKYFIVKSKRNSDYCERLVGDTTQTCQQFAAVTKFAAKNKNNPSYKVFNRYYKRYHERKNVGTIKPAIFEKWNREACVMRDECIDGKHDLAEFEQWCYDSFPNRKR